MSKLIYLSFHNKFFDKIIQNKRREMLKIIQNEISDLNITSCLDIGTSSDKKNDSTNFLIKNLKKGNKYKSISNQEIQDSFFDTTLVRSITENLDQETLETCTSDLVISSATIEHVGSEKNQIKMVPNLRQTLAGAAGGDLCGGDGVHLCHLCQRQLAQMPVC